MATISKCKVCGNSVPKSNPIMTDPDSMIPFRLCSMKCLNSYYEREAVLDAEGYEWSARCAKAIAKGEAESGRKFEEAGDGLIMSWIDKYAYEEEKTE